jgi:hypothetical protein
MRYLSTLFILLNFSISISQSIDPRPKDQANVFWNGSYSLFSLTSGKEIKPDMNGRYFFWYATNENPVPTEGSLLKGQVNTVYKFINYNECFDFCNMVRKNKNLPLLSNSNQISSGSANTTNPQNLNQNVSKQTEIPNILNGKSYMKRGEMGNIVELFFLTNNRGEFIVANQIDKKNIKIQLPFTYSILDDKIIINYDNNLGIETYYVNDKRDIIYSIDKKSYVNGLWSKIQFELNAKILPKSNGFR